MSQAGGGPEGQSFYYSLRMYRPLCYSGKGVPVFLLLREGSLTSSLPCIVFINLLTILVVIMQYVGSRGSNKDEQGSVLATVNILAIVLIDVFYVLTVTLNPGVISEEDMEVEQGEVLSFCVRCNRKINSEMKHCIECSTCVSDLDHHCGFFGKCIAWRQRFAFYGFLTFMFVGFISLLGSLSFVFTSM